MVGVIPGTKWCPGCNQIKSSMEFGRSNQRTSGLQSKCRDCKKQETKRGNEHYRHSLRPQVSYHSGSGSQRYYISRGEYERLLVEQGGACAICRQPETRRHKNGTLHRLCIDHDHKTGAIRGLLCTRCNIAVGSFKDNPEHMERAIEYLRKAVTAIKIEQLKLFDC